MKMKKGYIKMTSKEYKRRWYQTNIEEAKKQNKKYYKLHKKEISLKNKEKYWIILPSFNINNIIFQITDRKIHTETTNPDTYRIHTIVKMFRYILWLNDTPRIPCKARKKCRVEIIHLFCSRKSCKQAILHEAS